MPEFKPDYIITEMKKNVILAWGRPNTHLEEYVPGHNRAMEHVLYIDGEVGPGTFYSECLWFFPQHMVDPAAIRKNEEMLKSLKPGEKIGPQPHIHPFDELFTFFGTNFDDPSDLCGEMEFYLEDQPVTFNKSCILYIPAGMKHCPLNMKRMERPLFHFSMGYTSSYDHTVLHDRGGKYAGEKDLLKYFAFRDQSEGKLPSFRRRIPAGFIHRVASMDASTIPEADFHAETSWIWPGERSGLAKQDLCFVDKHIHTFQQIIAFFGSDFDDIHNLHAEVELWVKGESYKIKKSFVAIIPEYVEHGPVKIRKVEKPVFHYTVGHAKFYS